MRQVQIRKKVKEMGVEAFNALAYFNGKFPNNIPHPAMAGDSFFVEYSGGRDFWSLMIDGKLRISHLRGAIKLLTKVQKAAKTGLEEGLLSIDDVLDATDNYFTERVCDIFGRRMLDDEGIGIIRKNYWPVEDVLRGLPREVYCDRNLKNNLQGSVLKNLDSLPVFTDFEGLRLLPPHLDLVNLLEFYMPYLQKKQISELVRLYVKESRKQSVFFDESSFLRGYEYAAVQRHLELSGYRMRDVSRDGTFEDRKAAYFHLKRAQEYIVRICGESDDETKKKALSAVLEQLEHHSKGGENLDKLLAKDAVIRRAKEDNFIARSVIAVFVSASLLFTAYGAFQAEQRNIAFLNNPVFSGKNDFAVVRSVENERDGEKTLELYLGDDDSLAKMGGISTDCVSWSPSRSRVLFKKDALYELYDFASGSKKALRIGSEKFGCPTFRTEGELVGLTYFEFYGFDIRIGGDSKLLGFSPPASYALSKDKRRAAVVSKRGIISFDFAEFEKRELSFIQEQSQKVTNIAWSPSSEKFAFSDDKFLYVAQHSLDEIWRTPIKENAGAILWLSEQELVLSVTQPSANGDGWKTDLYKHNMQKGSIEKVVNGDESLIIPPRPVVSPDLRQLAYMCGGSICIFDGVERKANISLNIKEMLWSADSHRIYLIYYPENSNSLENIAVLDVGNLLLKQIPTPSGEPQSRYALK